MFELIYIWFCSVRSDSVSSVTQIILCILVEFISSNQLFSFLIWYHSIWFILFIVVVVVVVVWKRRICANIIICWRGKWLNEWIENVESYEILVKLINFVAKGKCACWFFRLIKASELCRSIFEQNTQGLSPWLRRMFKTRTEGSVVFKCTVRLLEELDVLECEFQVWNIYSGERKWWKNWNYVKCYTDFEWKCFEIWATIRLSIYCDIDFLSFDV